MLAAAIVVCSVLLTRDAVKAGISRDMIYDFTFWVILGGILLARVYYVGINWEFFAANPLEMIMLNHGGLAWQGGFVGGTAAGILFVRLRKVRLRQFMDLVAPYVALGQSIGRIGCFFNGCCYGKPWIHGLFFPTQGAKLYPTQLFETSGLFAIFLVLKMLQRKPHAPGMIFVYYLWLAAIERFVVEFFRGDHTLLWGGLSQAQYVALGVFAAGFITQRILVKKQ